MAKGVNATSLGETGRGSLSGSGSSDSADLWPMFHHDLNHTGYSTSTAPKTNETLWNYTTGGTVWSSPAVVNGVVYVGSNDRKVYALNAIDGSSVWNFTIGYQLGASSPAVAGGIVYIGCGEDYRIYALNATTGAFMWSYKTSSSVDSSPAVADGTVYFGSYDGKVYALNATTGSFKWSYTTGYDIASSPAVVGGVVYIGSQDGKVYALNATTGASKWNYTTLGGIFSSPAVVGGVVYIGSNDYMVYALNATTGTLKWSYMTGGFVFSSPAVVGGVVYVGSQDGKVYALNVTTGASIWSYTTGDRVFSSPAVADSVVYFGSYDGKVYALNATTGAFKWSYMTGGFLGVGWSSPAIVNGIVYEGSTNGQVYAFGVPPEMLVYGTVVPDITEAYVASLALNVFGITGPAYYDDGFYVMNSSYPRVLTVYEASGSVWYADLSKGYNDTYVPEHLPSPETALLNASSFLNAHGLLPPEMEFDGYGNTTTTFIDTVNASANTFTNCLHVNFGAKINGTRVGDKIPVIGGGAEIKVMIGDGGEVIGLNWDWRSLEPAGYWPVMTEADALQVFREKYDVDPSNDTRSVELAYYAEPGLVNQTWLLPHYILDGEVVDEGERISLKTQILTATSFSPFASITEPIDESLFYDGAIISFSASVVNGTPPFRYIWESDVDGILYEGPASSFTRSLTVSIKEEEILPHVITLTIVDSNGIEDTDRTSVTIIRSVGGVNIPIDKFGILGEFLRSSFALGLIVLMGAVGVGLTWRMKKRRKAVGLVLMSMIVPSTFVVSLPTGVATGPKDDSNLKEIGIEWVNKYKDDGHKTGSNLYYNDNNARGFAKKLEKSPFYWSEKFDCGNEHAWEEDFKYSNNGGTDYKWIDSVDFAYFSGHGSPNAIVFSYKARGHDSQWFYFSNARWGGNDDGSTTEEADLEWIVLDACKTLEEGSGSSYVWWRWAYAFCGLHGILGFHTTTRDTAKQGKQYGDCLSVYGNTVWAAWQQSTETIQWSDVWGAYLYAYNINANPKDDTVHPYNVSADPVSPWYIVYSKWQC